MRYRQDCVVNGKFERLSEIVPTPLRCTPRHDVEPRNCTRLTSQIVWERVNREKCLALLMQIPVPQLQPAKKRTRMIGSSKVRLLYGRVCTLKGEGEFGPEVLSY
jgi:hypothetical protein